MATKLTAGFLALCAIAASPANAQTPANMAVLRGLAPVIALFRTPAGRAALAANFSVTGGIQSGAIRQPTLFPFAEQQQALRDAYITNGNLAQLADGSAPRSAPPTRPAPTTSTAPASPAFPNRLPT